MAIEKHMLQTHSLFEKAGEVLEGVVGLKTRLSAIQSEKMQLEDDNALLRRNNEELRKENESLKYYVATLDTDLAMATRWRKCSEELPNDGETVLVLLGRTPKTRGFFLTSRYVAGVWTYGEDPQGCKPTLWFRIPKAPENL